MAPGWTAQELLTAYGAGWLALMSACAAPLWAALLAILTGTRLTAGGQPERRGAPAGDWGLLHFVGFLLGFAAMFTLTSLPASQYGFLAFTRQPVIRRLGGLAAFLLGLHLAGLLPGFFSKGWGGSTRLPQFGLAGYCLAGIGLGAAWSPCRLTVVGPIMLYGATAGHLLDGLVLMAAYLVGLLGPLFLGGLALALILRTFRWLLLLRSAAGRVAGLLLAVFGIAMFFNMLPYLSPPSARNIILAFKNIFP